MSFSSLLPKMYSDIEIENNRVVPCPVCGSKKKKPCVILENDLIYCHDTSCDLNERPLDINQFLKLTGKLQEVSGNSKYKADIIKTEQTTPVKKEPVIVSDTQRQIWKDVSEFAHYYLLRNQTARKYQTNDRDHDLDTLRHFKTGYLDNTYELYNALLKTFKGNKELIATSGLFTEKGKFRLQLKSYTYPIFINGIIQNIKFKTDSGGGYIEKEFTGNDFPLWLNSDVLQTSDEIFIVEGENDLLSMYEAGYKNTIATLGGITKRHVENLLSLDRKTLILAFDNDDAGKKNIEKCMQKLKLKHTLKVAEYDGSDPDECIKQGNGKFEIIDQKITISNCIQRSLPSGKSYHEYIREITPEMKLPLGYFYCFKNFEEQKVIYFKKDNRKIAKPDELTISLLDCGFVLDLHNGGLRSGEYLEYIKQNVEVCDRFSRLNEINPDRQTKYITQRVIGEKNGSFKKLMSVFTTETTKDQYRLAAGFLSGFLNREYDGKKPLFSLIADHPSSGKTEAVRRGVNIVQGAYPIDLFGDKKDDESIGSQMCMANKYALYDNLEFPSQKQVTQINITITNPNIKYWEMNTSHSFVRNSKTFFATFNNDQALKRDLLQRVLIIRMKDSRDIAHETKSKIMRELDVFDDQREDIVKDITAYFTEIDWDRHIPYSSHPKFTKWSKIMAKILHVFYPEVESFDFDLSADDREIDVETVSIIEMIDGIMKGDNVVRISNADMLEKYKEFFGEKDLYARNATALTRKLKTVTKSIKKYRMEHKVYKEINGKPTRGWEIELIGQGVDE